MHLLLRIAVIFFIVLIFYYLLCVIASGRRRVRLPTPDALNEHRIYVQKLIYSFCTAVLLVLLFRDLDMVLSFVLSRQIGAPVIHGRPTPFLIMHWCVDIIAILALIAAWFTTGLDNPRLHRRIAYIGVLPSLMIVLITGTILTMLAR